MTVLSLCRFNSFFFVFFICFVSISISHHFREIFHSESVSVADAIANGRIRVVDRSFHNLSATRLRYEFKIRNEVKADDGLMNNDPMSNSSNDDDDRANDNNNNVRRYLQVKIVNARIHTDSHVADCVDTQRAS